MPPLKRSISSCPLDDENRLASPYLVLVARVAAWPSNVQQVSSLRRGPSSVNVALESASSRVLCRCQLRVAMRVSGCDAGQCLPTSFRDPRRARRSAAISVGDSHAKAHRASEAGMIQRNREASSSQPAPKRDPALPFPSPYSYSTPRLSFFHCSISRRRSSSFAFVMS